MKRKVIFVVLMILVRCSQLCQAIIYDDGQTHDIYEALGGSGPEVMNDFFGAATTMNFHPGGASGTSLMAYDDSVINVLGGTINGHLIGYHNSSITISSGTVTGYLDTNNYSNAIVSGGTFDYDVHARDYSNITISGGVIERSLFANEHGDIIMSGGTIGSIIYAGTSYENSTSTITFMGSNFAINGISVGYGEFDSGGTGQRHGILTGNLSNGGLLNNEFYIYSGSSIVLIPEPATLLLLGLGGLLIKK